MRNGCLTVFALLCCVFSSMAAATSILGVRSYQAPDHTRVVFDLDGPAEHSLFTLEQPERVVIDLTNTTLATDLGSLDLQGSPLHSIRSAPQNDTDLRIVFDMNRTAKPRSFSLGVNEQYGHRLVIDLYDEDAGQPVASEPRVTLSETDLAEAKRDIVVAISAGHGGEDPGAIGVGRLMEKRVVHAISRELETILNNTPGYRAVMIREGDYYVGLRKRTRIAHEHKADFYISIHADAYTTSQARGATVYALSQRGATSEQAKRLAEKENGADLIGGVGSVSLNDKDETLASVLLDLSTTASIASSLQAGDRIIAAMGKVTHMRRTNVEQAAFVELKNVDIPSLLIETGYITNETDAANLNSRTHQRKLAQAMAEGITAYFYNTPPRGTLISWQKENGIQPGTYTAADVPGSYTVVSGDNLSEIADRFGISLASLKKANGISGNTIYIGQTLTIPSAGSVLDTALSFIEHTIARGETLSGIASNYRIPLQRILDINQLDSDVIHVGQILRIPSS